MDDLYSNLLRATDNTNDITNEKYAIITAKNDTTYNVKELNADLEHLNVASLCPCNVGDNVILGFVENSLYNPIILGVVGFDGLDHSIYELKENKVSAWSGTVNDVHYPTEKLVKDSLDTKIAKSNTSGLVKNDGSIDTNTYLTTSSASSTYVMKDNGANTMTDSSAYSNLETSSGATQKQINNAINEKIGMILTTIGNCEDLLGGT